MKSIHCYSPLYPVLSQLKHKQEMRRVKLFWLSTNPPIAPLQRQSILLPIPPRTRAITSSLVVGVNLPAATTGNLTVLLQTTAVFLFVYWIANFVVPGIIYKDLQGDDTSKNQQPNEDNSLEDEEESTPISRTRSSQRKKGFQSTKL